MSRSATTFKRRTVVVGGGGFESRAKKHASGGGGEAAVACLSVEDAARRSREDAARRSRRSAATRTRWTTARRHASGSGGGGGGGEAASVACVSVEDAARRSRRSAAPRTPQIKVTVIEYPGDLGGTAQGVTWSVEGPALGATDGGAGAAGPGLMPVPVRVVLEHAAQEHPAQEEAATMPSPPAGRPGWRPQHHAGRDFVLSPHFKLDGEADSSPAREGGDGRGKYALFAEQGASLLQEPGNSAA